MQDNKQILIKKKEEFFQKKDFSSCKEYFNSIISFLEYLKDFTKKNEEKKITEADYQKIIDLFSSDNFSSSLKEEEKLIDTTISSFEEYEQTEIQKLQFKILDVQKEFFELKKKYA
jgi:thiaminase